MNEIDELQTEEDEIEYVIQAAAAMKKDELSFKRLREFLLKDHTPLRWWEKVFGRRERTPAGGGG